jgi:hypothetical protein
MLRLSRFVYRDEAPFAIYRVVAPKGHDRRIADIAISFGNWDDNGSQNDRVAFALWVEARQAAYDISIVEPEQTAWPSSPLGKILSRSEARTHPWLPDAYAVLEKALEGTDRLETISPVKIWLKTGTARTP